MGWNSFEPEINGILWEKNVFFTALLVPEPNIAEFL